MCWASMLKSWLWRNLPTCIRKCINDCPITMPYSVTTPSSPVNCLPIKTSGTKYSNNGKANWKKLINCNSSTRIRNSGTYSLLSWSPLNSAKMVTCILSPSCNHS